MKLNAAYMILASIGGASFNTLLWWNHLPLAKQGRARKKIATTFIAAALPAPFFALGGQDYVYFAYPWTRDYPYLALLGAFLCGAFSPFLMSAARRWLEQRASRIASGATNQPTESPDNADSSGKE